MTSNDIKIFVGSPIGRQGARGRHALEIQQALAEPSLALSLICNPDLCCRFRDSLENCLISSFERNRVNRSTKKRC